MQAATELTVGRATWESSTSPKMGERTIAGPLFVVALFVVASFATWSLCNSIEFTSSNALIALLWIAGFFVLSLNVAYMLLTAIIARCFPPALLPEADLMDMPACDVVFVAKHEPAEVFDNMEESLAGNLQPRARLVFISNSTDRKYLDLEAAGITRLRRRFGESRVVYWRSQSNPMGRKHTAVQQWLREETASPYAMLCDADSVIPENMLSRLIRKGEHPNNQDIAAFQAGLRVRATQTHFSHYLRMGTEFAQRVYMASYQRIFRCCPYFGHGALLRRSQFKWMRVPASALSHDIWDMALLSRRGYRVAFCPDVYTYEELPWDYLEVLRRDKRWAEGTIQSGAVLKLPGISFANRFFVCFAIYTYVSQPIFLAWLLLGFLEGVASNGVGGELGQQLAFLGVGTMALDGGAMYLPILLIVFLHRMPMCRGFREVFEIVRELLFSTVIFLNSVLYSSWAVIMAPFGKRSWIPMAKGAASTTPGLMRTLRAMAPSLVVGITMLAVGSVLAPGWVICASPFLVSFTIGPIVVHLTSRRRAVSDC